MKRSFVSTGCEDWLIKNDLYFSLASWYKSSIELSTSRIQSMDEKLVAAIAGAIAGVIGGLLSSLVAPWINWGIEKRKQKLVYRRELIAKWRASLAELAKTQGPPGERGDLMYLMERSPEFYSLLPHLKDEKATLKKIKITKFVYGETTIPLILHRIMEEVNRIEREWDLV